jgi:hypothetical protein
MAQQIGVQGVRLFLITLNTHEAHAWNIRENLRELWEEGSFGPQLTVLNATEGDSWYRWMRLNGI